MVSRQTWFAEAKSIGLYYPFGEEVNGLGLLRFSWQYHQSCYLPKLDDRRPIAKILRFAPLNPQSKTPEEASQAWSKNTYGIWEPRIAFEDCLDARNLDIVFLPLVGFDARGHRLGTGAGYYDATLGLAKPRPLCVGLGFNAQEVNEGIPNDPWDIPLDFMVTETRVIQF